MVSSLSRRVAWLPLLLVLMLPTRSLAQITVVADDYNARLGQRFTLHLAPPADTLGLQALADLTGPDQTFDFTSLDLDASAPLQVAYMPLPADVPGSDQRAFIRADHVVRLGPDQGEDAAVDTTAWWIYRSLDAAGVTTQGFFANVGLDSPTLPDSLGLPDTLLAPLDSLTLGDTLLAYMSPPLRTTALPLVAGAAWTSTGITAVEWGEATVLMTASLNAQVDGYGTLITPDGTAACLRLRSTYTFQIPLTEFRQTFQVIRYITKSDLSALLIFDGNGTPLLAGYGAARGPVPAEPTPATFDLTLGPATPHPFSQGTTLRYTLPAAGPVRLRLFDVLGREVRTLVNATQLAGPHRLRLDASDLPAGLYVARLDAGGKTRTQTLVRVQ